MFDSIKRFLKFLQYSLLINLYIFEKYCKITKFALIKNYVIDKEKLIDQQWWMDNGRWWGFG